MRALVLVVSLLVVVLVHALMLVPQSESRHWNTTEEIRTAQGTHHHKSMASFTDDTNDDGDDDDDDDVLATGVPIVIAPMAYRSHGETVVTLDDTLGPSTSHERLLERPPRS